MHSSSIAAFLHISHIPSSWLVGCSTYAPQWGGFCAYGIAEEDWWTADSLGPHADPDVWEIIDDKLYVFMYNTPRDKFDAGDITSEMESGDSRWSGWFGDELVFNTACFWACTTTDTTSEC